MPPKEEKEPLPTIGCPTCGCPADVTDEGNVLISRCGSGHKHELGREAWLKRLHELKPKPVLVLTELPCPTCGIPANAKETGPTIETRCKVGHVHELGASWRKQLNLPAAK